MTQTLRGELADGQRKLMSLATAGASSNAANPLISQISNGLTAGFHEKVTVWPSLCYSTQDFSHHVLTFVCLCNRLKHPWIQQKNYLGWYTSTNMRRLLPLPCKEVMFRLFPGYALRYTFS